MRYIYTIMTRKSEINVGNKTSITEIKTEMSKCKGTVRYYERLIAIQYILEGHTIKEASDFVNVSYKTVHRWAKSCEEKGLKGLEPKFGGGRPSKLTFNQLVELDNYIMNHKGMTQTDVLTYIKNEYEIEYSLKQIGVIVEKLGYNYSKAYPRFSKTPDDTEEQLKKT